MRNERKYSLLPFCKGKYLKKEDLEEEEYYDFKI